MKKVLIIGASGFIGRHVTAAFVQNGYYVIATQSTNQFVNTYGPNVSQLYLDVTSGVDFRQILEGVDIVVYLVSTVLPQQSNEMPIFDIETNLIPVVRLLDAARSVPNLKIIFSSSGGTVYGVANDAVISESHPTDPICSYGIIKLTIEKYMLCYKKLYGINSIILRISNPYGFGQDINRPQGAVGVFLRKIANGEEINLWGDGEVIRDYIHVSDVAAAFVAAANYIGEQSVFNIGTGVGTSLNNLLKLLQNKLDKSASIKRFPARHFDVRTNVLSIQCAMTELQWLPKYSLSKGLEFMSEAHAIIQKNQNSL